MELQRAGINIDPAAAEAKVRAEDYERLGYGALWIAGGQLTSLSLVGELIAATGSAAVGTAIIPTGVFRAEQVVETYAELEAVAPGRFLVGLGGQQSPRSLPALRDYLDRLDRSKPAVPVERRYLAALGPRKLDLARERFAGAITLLATPGFTAQTRDRLGETSQQIVHLPLTSDTDAERARSTGRQLLGFLLQVPGYQAHVARLGFTDTEIEGVEDRVVDALVPWGDPVTLAAEVRRHWDAGADQVVISPQGEADDLPAALADLLDL
jgi:probable F420-dependent oxidoreductase